MVALPGPQHCNVHLCTQVFCDTTAAIAGRASAPSQTRTLPLSHPNLDRDRRLSPSLSLCEHLCVEMTAPSQAVPSAHVNVRASKRDGMVPSTGVTEVDTFFCLPKVRIYRISDTPRDKNTNHIKYKLKEDEKEES